MKVIGTSSVPIYRFLSEYKEKQLFLPDHQLIRGDVWSKKKKKTWWKKIENSKQLPGLITTYELATDVKSNRTKYLNDGANRSIHSLIAYEAECLSQNKLDDFQKTLMNCTINEQYIRYEDEAEAIQDFIDINSQGTAATTFEILSCQFVSGLSNYATIWRPILEKIHNTVSERLAFLGYKGLQDQKRDTNHKYKRDSMASFVRFMTKDTSKWSPAVTNKSIDFENPRHRDLEDRCLSLLQEAGPSKVQAELESFDDFLERAAALYFQIWQECKYGPFIATTETAVRWWISFAIYHRNNEFENSTLRTFTENLLKIHRGKTTMIYKGSDGSNTNINAQLQNLGNIVTIYRACDLTAEKVETKKSRKFISEKLLPGFCHSHKNAFAVHGEGETIPENAMENGYRLNRDMTLEESKKLKDLSKLF